MTDSLLILNAGSSSLKFSVFRDCEPPELLLRGQLASLQSEPRFTVHDLSGQVVDEQAWPAGSSLSHQQAIEFLFDWGQRHRNGGFHLVAAGHRVVHGGTKFLRPVRVDDHVIAELDSLVPLAPLHQPHNLAAIRAIARQSPKLPQVACFDTSFHRTQPSVAQQFALPRDLTATGIQRYGFHGLSYEYIASRLPRNRPACGRWPHGSGSFGKWRKSVCIEGRSQHCNHDGLYAARWISQWALAAERSTQVCCFI